MQSSLLQDIRDDIAKMSSQVCYQPDLVEADAATPSSPHHADESDATDLPPTASERRNRGPGSKSSGIVVPSEEQATSGHSAAEKANVVAEYVEMNSSDVKAIQICGFANGRIAGDKERMFIGKAVMKSKGQMVIGFSN